VERIKVGVLGATGAVGQRFVQLLDGHPWFEIVALAASDRSTGRPYSEACRWLLSTPMPDAVREMTVLPSEPGFEARLVFSALPGDLAGPVEQAFAGAGYAVSSNTSTHRMEPNVPLLIPERQPRSRGPDRRATPQPGRHRLHRHQSELLHHRSRAGPQAAARQLRAAPGDGDHHAGHFRGRLPRRGLTGHPGQRDPLHRRRGTEDGERAAETAGDAGRRPHRAGRLRHQRAVQPCTRPRRAPGSGLHRPWHGRPQWTS